jgi:hypothetical protein
MTVRLKILKKIAQTNAPAETPPMSQPVAGNPAAVSVSAFPTTNLGWGSNNISYIQKIIDALNVTIYQLSNGKTDFDKLEQQNFNFDASTYTDPLKGIIALANSIFETVLTNNGVDYKQALTPEQKKNIIDDIKGDVSSGTIPDGGITPVLPNKIGGNFKTIILNTLNNIK